MTTAERARTPVAERLLAASDEPAGDWRALDWAGSPVPDAPWLPWEQVSLYGTPLWAELTVEQRLALSRHELASVTAAGIWSENSLMQMLLRVAYEQDPRDARARYALVEVADECRHSLMFARLLSTLDTPAHGPRPAARRLAAVFARTASPAEVFAAALVVEEVLDAFQRAAMVDERVQPLARAVSRLHVVEEARHIAFARQELGERWSRLRAPARAVLSVSIAVSAAVTTGALVDPGVYAAVGIDPVLARRQVGASAHRKDLLATAARRLVDDFSALGLITAAARPIWRRAGLI